MTTQQTLYRLTPCTWLAALLVLSIGTTVAAAPLPQDGRPQAAPPIPQSGDAGSDTSIQDPDAEQDDAAVAEANVGEQQVPPTNPGNVVRERPQRGPDDVGAVRRDVVGNIYLNFNDITVPETFPWLVEVTGKVVMPVNLPTLNAKKFTLMTDNALPQNEALDLLFRAFRLNGIGIVERDDVLIIGDINAGLGDLVGEIPVIGPDETVVGRQDLGTIVIKIFKLEKAPAQNVGDHLAEFFPDTYATLAIDPNSNQIVIMGDLALARTCETIVKMLDQEWVKGRLRTFHLRYADASLVADNVFELFESSGTNSNQSNNNQRRGQPQNQRQGGGGPAPGETTPGLEVELRVTVNTQQNAVTVFAEPSVIEEITRLIDTVWDIPRAPETSKVYQLQHSDPIQIRDLLANVLGSDTGSAGGGGGAAARQARGGGNQQTSVADSLSGIYRFEAFPEANSLVVVVKTKESLDFLDNIIMQLDQPSTVGLPVVVPLKHARAVDLANELNALLAEAGAQVNINAPEQGLTMGDQLGSISQSQDGSQGGGQSAQSGGQAQALQFPWQRGREADDRSPESSLIGRVRIVPIVRQNALAILAPVAQREAVRELINTFDSPGRQVMIQAVIAEVELTDDLALGLRVSGSGISPSNPDNSISGSVIGSATEDLNLFDTATLEIGMTANVVLQALDEITNVRIITQPRVFTADNQEAYFFDGQDVPFITDSNVSDFGQNQSFEYTPVGVGLNIRPHITSNKDIDLEINLELSSVVPGQTLFGGFILDRRETTTKIVVENGQTIVLSGILRDQQSEIERKVPLLGDIPIIGALFKSVENSNSTTELVAFITPIVVDNPSENDTNFMQEDRDRLNDMMRPVGDQSQDENRDEAFERIRRGTRLRDIQPPDDDLQ